MIDRGSRGINFMLGALVFNVVPTLFEVAMVASILTAKCGPLMGLLTLATLAGGGWGGGVRRWVAVPGQEGVRLRAIGGVVALLLPALCGLVRSLAPFTLAASLHSRSLRALRGAGLA